MTLGFSIMWTPYSVCVIFPEVVDGKTFGTTAEFVTGWLGSANSFVNPLLYIFTLRSYRKIFKKKEREMPSSTYTV